MGKAKTQHVCTECDYRAARWFGTCPSCGTVGSCEERVIGDDAGQVNRRGGSSGATAAPFIDLASVTGEAHERFSSGVEDLDRVLGGGVVPGSYIILGAEPGAGKSTLCSQVASILSGRGERIGWVAGEESPGQVKMRFDRLGANAKGIAITQETQVERVAEMVKSEGHTVLIVDSIQTVYSGDSGGMPGSIGQVRACGLRLMELAKEHGVTVIVIGQVTKEGELAGPRTLEHMVDVVLAMEGDERGLYRLLRATKNRFGTIDEIGVFAMTATGLEGVDDPSAAFVARRDEPAPGSAVCPVIEGSRPLLIEVQALVSPSRLAQPIRAARGIDSRRFQLIIAVLNRHANMRLGSCDVYLQLAGGISVQDPALDLACALAIASAHSGRAVKDGSVACGELSLLGEVRPVGQAERRAAEATRLGFGNVVSIDIAHDIRMAIDTGLEAERREPSVEELAQDMVEEPE